MILADTSEPDAIVRLLQQAVPDSDKFPLNQNGVADYFFGISFLVRYLRNPNPRLTVRLLRAFGARVGNRTTFKRSLILDNTYEDENSTG